MRRVFPVSSLCSRCARKLQQSRFYATSASTSSLSVPVLHRAFIRVRGPASIQFLQGLITKNIATEYDTITRNYGHESSPRHIYTAFLNAQGRVLNDAFLWVSPSDPESWTVEVDEKEAKSLFAHLRKHKLRSKIELKLLEEKEKPGVISQIPFGKQSEDAARLSNIMGGNSQARDLLASLQEVTKANHSPAENRPHMRSRLLLKYDEGMSTTLRTAIAKPLGDMYVIHRLVHGIPEGQSEILRETALPQESNIDLLGGIDFRKGCYLGQELTIRTHHMGVVRKRILPVQLYAFDEPQSPSNSTGPIFKPDTSPCPLGLQNMQIAKVGAQRGRSVGKLLTKFGNVGLALCRLEMMTDIRLTEECTSYDPQQEFMVSWEAEGSSPAGKAKLKAFVPEWVRQGIAAGFKSHEREQEPDLAKNIEADVPGTDEELTTPHGAFGLKSA